MHAKCRSMPRAITFQTTSRSAAAAERASDVGELPVDTYATNAVNPPLRIAYIMSRFPKITETFILFEMLSAEQQGARLEIYPLWRERTRVMHPEARSYVARAHFLRLMSWHVFSRNLRCLCERPRQYFGALWAGVRANWGSPRFFIGFLATFPKAVAMGDDMVRRGIEHVHAHFASHPAAVAFVIRRLFGLPFSFTAHGSDLHRDRHMLREKVREATFVVAISSYNRDVIVRTCGEHCAEKVAIIHCGTDTDVFAPRPSAPGGPRNTKTHLTCVGTLHEVKGQRPLIEACALLKSRGVDFQLNLVGDGPDQKLLEEMVELHQLTEQVVFSGRCTRSEVAAILRSTDIVVAPSVPTQDGRREGIPVALMEAMACGVPVVASQISGIPELVADGTNGRLVPPNDAQALADALEQLICAPELRYQLGRAARVTVQSRFNLHRNAQQLLKTIRRSLPRSEPVLRSAPGMERTP